MATRPIAVGGPLLAALIFGLAFSPWGAATQTGTERPVEARATQAPFPRANSIPAAMNMPSESAMKTQCQDAATARRTGPGSCSPQA